MGIKQVRIEYQAKANTTGLTDVKAQVYLNGSPKAVGAGALLLNEVDATNSPGLYELVISPSTLATWGVVAGGENNIAGYINSASAPAFAPFRQQITFYNTDDIESTLGSPAGASVSADIAAVKSDTAAIKTDLETGPNSLANILTGINQIKNNAGFAIPVPAELLIPSSGNNTYRIPVTIYNENNSLVDPDSDLITVGLVNQAGADRGSYLSGSSGVPATVSMTRDSLGQYHVDVVIPSSAVQEEPIFTFSYAIGGAPTARKAVTETLTDIAASGFALQSTLLLVKADTDATQAIVSDATNGNAAIKTAVVGVQNEIVNNVEGTGFNGTNDSLHAISTYVRANLFLGGRAV